MQGFCQLSTAGSVCGMLVYRLIYPVKRQGSVHACVLAHEQPKMRVLVTTGLDGRVAPSVCRQLSG